MDDPLGPLGEILQELEFAVREVQRVGLRRLLGAEVDDDPAERQLLDRRASAPQDGMDPRQQLLQIERLGDVVVGAQIQPPQLVQLLAACRQDDDGRATALPQHRAQIETVRAREHDIEHDEIRRELADLRERGVPIGHARDLEAAVGEVVPQHSRKGRVVVGAPGGTHYSRYKSTASSKRPEAPLNARRDSVSHGANSSAAETR